MKPLGAAFGTGSGMCVYGDSSPKARATWYAAAGLALEYRGEFADGERGRIFAARRYLG
jgi:hypothetical protein